MHVPAVDATGRHRARRSATMVERLPMLRAVGQVNATYVVAEGPDGMYLVDQHAAHERVLYERFLAAVRDGRAGGAGAAGAADGRADGAAARAVRRSTRTRSRGWGSRSSTSATRRSSCGRCRRRCAGDDIAREIAGAARPDGARRRRRRSRAHRVAASLACHAVGARGHDACRDEEQRELLRLLEGCASRRGPARTAGRRWCTWRRTRSRASSGGSSARCFRRLHSTQRRRGGLRSGAEDA